MRNDNSEPTGLLKAEIHIEFLENLATVTKEIWQPFYEETLTDGDAVEIHDNIIKFGELAFRWCRSSNKNKNNVIEFDGE